jgi:serine phosphatase RsbU (regulator of sigma subunit)
MKRENRFQLVINKFMNSLRPMISAIFESIQRFQNDTRLEDDRTLGVVKIVNMEY